MLDANTAGMRKGKSYLAEYQRMKKGYDAYVRECLMLSRVQPFENFPVDFVFLWVCPNKRTDKDNVAAGRKFVFDAVSQMELWPNDGWKHVGVWEDQWAISKSDPHVQVTFMESVKEKR
jgi:hypothetical protein